MPTETCSNCGLEIEEDDTPFVWKDRTVCGLCHEMLQAGQVDESIGAGELARSTEPLPVLHRPHVPVHPGEIAHFEFRDVSLFQQQVVSREYVSQSEGLTLYDQGLDLSFGSTRGRVVDRKGDVRLGEGWLVLTSHRVVFAARTGGLSVSWADVLSVSRRGGRTAITTAALAPGEPPLEFASFDADVMGYSLAACHARFAG